MRKGKRVSFCRRVTGSTEFKHGGTYQQYCLAEAIAVNPLPEDLPSDVAAMNFVNPLTSIGLVEDAQKLGAKAIVQTGATSQCGKMVAKLAKQSNIDVINIVRREE